jgi:hypothetical protein
VGNCCTSAACSNNAVCTNNQCTTCTTVSDGNYKVDPVNGDDARATGSGATGSGADAACAFKTITRALQFIGPSPAAGTKITVVGVSGMSTNLAAGEVYPIVVPGNVTITTSTGAIRATPPNGAIGFRVNGGGGGIAPDMAALLTIDGGQNNQSGAGVEFALASASATSKLEYVTVQNTGDHGVRVLGGTIAVGNGVTITSAGRQSARRSGLYVLNGVVNVAVATGAPAVFSQNTLHGIEVTGAGSVNITGVPVITGSPAVPNGQGTVVSQGNAAANLMIDQLPVAPSGVTIGTCVIDGLVSWGGLANGIRIQAGSRVKLRNSVSLANAGAGVYVRWTNSGATGNNLATIDLGTAATGSDAGKNYLQARVGQNQNLSGVCIELAANNGAMTLNAAGNLFSGPDTSTPFRDCTTSTPGAVTRNATCAGSVDIGNRTPDTTPITFTINNCTLP